MERAGVWLVRVVALAALFAGRSLVVPGVDAMALLAMRQSGGLLGLFNSPAANSIGASLFEVALMPLLVVSLVLVVLASSDPAVAARRQRIGVVVYLGWCLLSSYSQALLLELTGRDFGSDFGMVLVRDGGFRFRALAVLTWLAAAAVLWFLAQWVTRRGAILGAVLFTGALVGAQDLELLTRAWRSAQEGVPLFSPPFHALPWMVGLGALWLSSPKQWPVPGPAGFLLRSRLEVLLLPLAVGQLGRMSELASVPLSLGIAIAVAVSLYKHRDGRGNAVYLLVAALLPMPAVALVAFPLGARLLEQRAPGPFAGQGRFEVELSCAGASAEVLAHDARILEERLKRSRVVSSVKAEGTDRLRLALEKIASPQDVLAAVTPRYRLSFQLVARDESMLSPNALDWRAAGLQVASDYGGEVIIAPTAERLAPLLAQLEVPAGFELSIECRDRSGTQGCAPRLLETAGMLAGDTIREASAALDEQQHQPMVSLVFSAEGGERFANLTSETGRQLAIVLDGRVLSAPTIQSRIEGGRASITMGRTGPLEKQLAEAQRLANGLQSEPLQCDWLLATLIGKP